MDESWRISRDVAIRQRDEARAELQAAQERGDRAVVIAEHLFQMIPKEAWRDRGVEYMGQYEGDYWAEQTREEIQALAAQRTEESSDDGGLEPIETSPLTEREPDL